MNVAHDYDTLSLDELDRAAIELQFATLNMSRFLSEQCDDVERAQREIRLALALPPTVLLRSVERAEEIVVAGGVPSIAEIAAMIARTVATIRVIQSAMDRKRAGAALQ